MKYVVLGASAAGINGAQALRESDPKARITLISQDKTIYSRCMLHYYVSGDRELETLNFKDTGFFDKNNIEWMAGKTAQKLDEENKELLLSSGEKVGFDKLIITTGASAFLPPIPNLKLTPYILGLRTLDDCDRIKELAQKEKNAVVIGGGLIGADIMTALSHYDLKTHLVEVQEHIMALQLDNYTASVYQKLWEKMGVEFHFKSKVTSIELDGEKPVSVEINGSEKIPADFIVVASGVVPNTGFLEGSS